MFWEAGGGLGKSVGESAFGGSPSGFSTNYFFAYGVRLKARGLPIYGGFRITGLSQSTESSGSTSIQAPHLYIQFHLARLAIGIGAAPVIFHTTTIVSGSYSGIGVATWDFPITPEVSFVISGQLQAITGSSLSTNASGLGSFRFFFGEASKGGGSGDYRGYRYPYGNEKR